MISKNYVEIIGRVGSFKIREIGDKKVINMSVATNYAYIDKEKNKVLETTWIPVVAWSGKLIVPFEMIEKGTAVHVTGRIRNVAYTGTDGTKVQGFEILASSLSVFEEERKNADEDSEDAEDSA